MASVKYAAMISDLAGKVGGQNFQRGLASPIVRNISAKRQYNEYGLFTVATGSPKANLAYIAASWRGVSLTNKAAWAAATVLFPRTNKFGNIYTPSAYQLFCEFSLNLYSAGIDIVFTAPTTSTFVSPIYTLSYSSGPPQFTLTMSTVFTSAPYQTIIYATAYLSNGLAFKVSFLRTIAQYQFTSSDNSIDITDDITGLFGPVPTGTTIYVSVKQLNSNTGECNQLTTLVAYT